MSCVPGLAGEDGGVEERETDRQRQREGGQGEIRGGVGCDMSTNEYLYICVCLSVSRKGLTSSQNDSHQLQLGF